MFHQQTNCVNDHKDQNKYIDMIMGHIKVKTPIKQQRHWYLKCFILIFGMN